MRKIRFNEWEFLFITIIGREFLTFGYKIRVFKIFLEVIKIHGESTVAFFKKVISNNKI